MEGLVKAPIQNSAVFHGFVDDLAIGERTRDALQHKRRQSERVGNIAFGYCLAPDGKHVEPDPGEQTVLTDIRELRGSGISLRRIAATLNGRALTTRRGTAWRLEHVARICGQRG